MPGGAMAAGARLGSYEIVAPLGAGGMREVTAGATPNFRMTATRAPSMSRPIG